MHSREEAGERDRLEKSLRDRDAAAALEAEAKAREAAELSARDAALRAEEAEARLAEALAREHARDVEEERQREEKFLREAESRRLALEDAQRAHSRANVVRLFKRGLALQRWQKLLKTAKAGGGLGPGASPLPPPPPPDPEIDRLLREKVAKAHEVVAARIAWGEALDAEIASEEAGWNTFLPRRESGAPIARVAAICHSTSRAGRLEHTHGLTHRRNGASALSTLRGIEIDGRARLFISSLTHASAALELQDGRIVCSFIEHGSGAAALHCTAAGTIFVWALVKGPWDEAGFDDKVYTMFHDGHSPHYEYLAYGGECVAKLPGHRGCVTAFAEVESGQSRGERRLVSASMDGTLRVWSTSAAVPILASELRGHDGPVHCVCAIGAHVLSGSEDGTARLWDPFAEAGAPCLRLLRHDSPVHCVAAWPRAVKGGRGEFSSLCITGTRALTLWNLAEDASASPSQPLCTADRVPSPQLLRRAREEEFDRRLALLELEAARPIDPVAPGTNASALIERKSAEYRVKIENARAAWGAAKSALDGLLRDIAKTPIGITAFVILPNGCVRYASFWAPLFQTSHRSPRTFFFSPLAGAQQAFPRRMVWSSGL